MYESVVNKRKGKNVIIILFFLCWIAKATSVADVDWSVVFLFIADDVAIISVPTPNLLLHSNDVTYLYKALIIVGTIYYV